MCLMVDELKQEMCYIWIWASEMLQWLHLKFSKWHQNTAKSIAFYNFCYNLFLFSYRMCGFPVVTGMDPEN